MSTREVNADRKGPKNLMELANRMTAAKEHQDASNAWEDASKASAEGRDGADLAEVYNRFQNAQNSLLAAHGGDASAAQETLRQAAAYRAKGKTN